MQSKISFQIENINHIEDISTALIDELCRLLLHSYEDIDWIYDLLSTFQSADEIAEFILFFRNNEDRGIYNIVDFKNIYEFEEARMKRLIEWENKIGPLSSREGKIYLERFNIFLEDYMAFVKECSFKFSSSKDIFNHLDRHVVGQVLAKKHISTALYCHYLRMKSPNLPLPRKNILLVGPSGSGKTFLVETAAKIVQVPYIKIDAASLVKEGILGTTISDYFAGKFESLEDETQLQNAVVFIDEIDKIANGKSHYGTQVQTELLSLIGEGGQVNIKRNRYDNTNTISTANMLFVLGGAFETLTNESNAHKKHIGFSNGSPQIASNTQTVDRNDIISYGIMPEVVNRLQTIVPLHNLSKSNFLTMLTRSQSSELEAYQNFAQLHGKHIHFTDSFIEALADKASESSMNGRSIKNLLSNILLPVLLKCETDDSQEFIIDREYIERQIV